MECIFLTCSYGNRLAKLQLKSYSIVTFFRSFRLFGLLDDCFKYFGISSSRHVGYEMMNTRIFIKLLMKINCSINVCHTMNCLMLMFWITTEPLSTTTYLCIAMQMVVVAVANIYDILFNLFVL